jgi:hypothetical protein
MTFLPEGLDDWVHEDNPVRVIEAFVEALDLVALGFEGAIAKATGRPSEVCCVSPALIPVQSQPTRRRDGRG